MKEGSSEVLLQDVVHAYLWSLDPNHPGTIMLICNYKVRCISFDQFEELNNWVDVLKTYLTCNYFHADLILASKESKLYSYARRRWRLLRCGASRRNVLDTVGSTGDGIFRVPSTARDDGYLHVTRDRICFTTSPGCARPRLIATWTFDNDELIQCFTGRAISSTLSEAVLANLFCLTASPDHPEAPGSHLFISDRAGELYEWIEANNLTAVYQAEWRRLTSMATAFLDFAPLASLSSSVPSGLTAGFSPSPLGCNFCNYSLFNSECGTLRSSRSKHCTCQGTNMTDRSCNFHENSAQPNVRVSFSMERESCGSECEMMESLNISSLSISADADNRCKEIQIKEPDEHNNKITCVQGLPPSTTSVECDSKPEVKFVFPNASAQAEFFARKRRAMHSRRRFSSHPVETHGRPLMPFLTPLSSNSTGLSLRSTASPSLQGVTNGLRENSTRASPPEHGQFFADPLTGVRAAWRQSDSQLVPIPPFPVPLNDLEDFLHRYKCALNRSSCNLGQPPLSDMDSADHPKLTRNLLDQYPSGDNSANSVSSCHNSGWCAHCDSTTGDTPGPPLEPPLELSHATASDCRTWMPSSWSNATCPVPTSEASEGGSSANPRLAQKTSSLAFPTQRPPLNRSLSSGSSPQCSVTPLLPNTILIPGSQHFCSRRKHTASASEATSSSTALPVRQRAASIMDQYCVASLGTSTGSSTGASLVSLSSSVPIWADAPVFAKPRTGYNYMPREALLALRAQRKLQQQHQTPPGDPHPSSPSGPQLTEPSLTSSGTHSIIAHSSDGTTVIHAHPCQSTSAVHGEGNDSRNVSATDIANASLGSCPCSSRSLHRTTFSSSTMTTYEMSNVTCADSPIGFTSRSYVNMGPSTSSSRLQPIVESQPLHSALTDPITRLHRCSQQLPRVNTDDCNSHSATALPSYVNVPKLALINQPYVNLPPSPRAVSTGCNRGLHNILSAMEHCGLNEKRLPPSVTDGTESSASLLGPPSGPGNSNTTHRLHYAILTLTTTCSTSAGINIASVNTSALPESRSSQSSILSSSATRSPSEGTSDLLGVNYVTIDMAQTKALSELEQELRSSATTNSYKSTGEMRPSHQPSRAWAFRNTMRRGLANSTNETSKAETAPTQKCHIGRASYNGNSKPRDGATLSLPARVFTRLANSIQSRSSFNRKSLSRQGHSSQPRPTAGRTNNSASELNV